MHSTDQNPLQKTSSAQKNGEKNPLESPSKLGVSVIAKDGQSIVNNVEQAVTETSSLRVLDRDEKRVKKQKNLQNTLVGYLLGMNLEERDYRGNLVDFSSNYYVNEKDFNFGDYVLVFPNPDHPVYKNKLNYTFNFSETLQMLNKFFITTNTQDKSYANIFDRAFAIAFNQLKQSPIIGKKPDYIKRLNKKSGSKKDKPANEDIYEDLGIHFFEEKINIGGQFLQQDPTISKKSFSFSNKNTNPWDRSEESAKDLCTLLRNTLILKLGKELGFTVRSFISDDGSKIFLVLHAELHNLYQIAEMSSIDKELELAMSDLMSLEPLDSSFRPLRLHSFLLHDDYLEKKKLKNKDIETLRNQIRSHLEIIDYHRISLETHCKLFFHERENTGILNEAYVPIKTWKVYLEFLKLVLPLVEKWRKYYLGEPEINTEGQKFKRKAHTQHPFTDQEKCQALMEENMLKKGPKVKLVEFESMNPVSHKVRKRKEENFGRANSQIIKRLRTEELGQKYKHIFIKCLSAIQKKYGKKSLRNLWNYGGLERVWEAFSDFYVPSGNIPLKKKNRLIAVWKKYQINELGMTSIFLNMEKLKLIQRMFDSMFNLSMVKKYGFLLDYFFINDAYSLTGDSVERYFKSFRDSHLQQMIKKKSIKEIPKIHMEQDMYFSKIVPLHHIWKGFIKLPLRAIRDYYGEKIALFFGFLKFYILSLSSMSIFGAVMFFLNIFFQDISFFTVYDDNSDERMEQRILQVATFIFSIMTAIWSCMVVEIWEGKEMVFAVKYGQMEFELEELELASFEGNFRRSFHNDKMNEEYTNSLGRFFLYFLAMTLAIFIFIGNIIVSAVLNYLAENLNYLNSENFAYYAILICASINTFYIMITGFIYEKICVKLTTWENHKTASDYELSFTIKALIFRTINRLVPLVMIAFVNDYFSWSCGVNWYCWDYLLIYYRSMLYVFFTAQCLQYLNSAFIFLAKKAAYTLLKFAKSDKSNPYHKINKYIKKESIKLEFSPSEELDGTLSEFINMTVNFSMVSLFAVCFPVCFPMSAFLFFLSMHFNKLKLTKLCKRPKPVGAAAVGACKAVFHLVGYLSVLSNAGLLCNTMNLFGGSAALSYFVIIVMWIFLLKFLVQKLVVKVPDKTGLILLRSQMVADKTIKNKGNIAGTYRMSQKQPIYKVYGTLLQSRPKKIIEEEKENQDKKSNKDIANTKSNKDNSIPKNNNEIVNDPKSNKENGDNKDIKNKDIEMSKVGQKKKEEKKA